MTDPARDDYRDEPDPTPEPWPRHSVALAIGFGVLAIYFAITIALTMIFGH